MTEILCGYRYPRPAKCVLVVVHTNEGPEGPSSAENLAQYLHGLTASTAPGYHRTVDENSAVVTAHDDESVNGAGGVNGRAFHVCITGYAAQTPADWHDASSSAALRIAAAEVRAACERFGIPTAHITDPRTGTGICGHADVSRYYPASLGHTDPGDGFPWDEFMALVAGEDDMTAEQFAAMLDKLEQIRAQTATVVAAVKERGDALKADLDALRAKFGA